MQAMHVLKGEFQRAQTLSGSTPSLVTIFSGTYRHRQFPFGLTWAGFSLRHESAEPSNHFDLSFRNELLVKVQRSAGARMSHWCLRIVHVRPGCS